MVLKNGLVGPLIFPANLRRLELASSDKGGGLREIRGLRIDRYRQAGPFAPQLGGHRQTDDPGAEDRHGRLRLGAAHFIYDRLHVAAHHTRAAPAQRDAGAAVPIIVNEELRPLGGLDLRFERKADAASSMGPYAGDKPGILPELRKVGRREDFSAAQWSDAILESLGMASPRNGKH